MGNTDGPSTKGGGLQMSIESTWVLAFVGHRPSGIRTPDRIRSARPHIKRVFEDLLQRAHSQGGRLELSTGVAAGADLDAVEVAEELGMPVHILLPKPVADFLLDFGQLEDDRARAQTIIKKAIASEDGWSSRVVAGSSESPECFHEANVDLLDAADMLVAVWDGQPEQGLGGTAEVIAAAKTRAMPVIAIPLDDGEETQLSGDHKLIDWPHKSAIVADLQGDLDVLDQDTDPTLCHEVLEALDATATNAAGHFRYRLVWSILLHFVAAILAALTAALFPVFDHYASSRDETVITQAMYWAPKIMTAIEFALVTVAWWLMVQAHERHTHNQWRRARFGAEITRNIIATAGITDPLRPLVEKFDTAWRPFALTISLRAHREFAKRDFSSSLETYRRHLTHQERHFRSRHVYASRWKSALQIIAMIATSLAPPVIGLALWAKLRAGEFVIHSFAGGALASLLPILLPLCAGAATSALFAIDAARRGSRYNSMSDRLRELNKKTDTLKTPLALRGFVSDCELLLMHELMEWHGSSENVGH